MGHSSRQASHTSRKIQSERNPLWVTVTNGTLDKVTLTKAPYTARMTISKMTSTLAGMALGPLEGFKMERYNNVCDAERIAKMNH